MFRESLYSGLWPMAVVLLVLALPLQGHAGDEIRPLYEIRDAEVPDLHDGSLADWQRLFPEPALTEKDFFQAIEAQDLRVNIYLGWSGTYNRLYMAVERLEAGGVSLSRKLTLLR